MDTATPPLPPLLASPAPDLTCLHCGYFLRGLDRAGLCPECGTPIRQSADNQGLNNIPRSWFTSVRLGIAAFALAEFLLLVYYVASYWPILLSTLPRSYRTIYTVLACIHFIIATFRWWAVQLIARPRRPDAPFTTNNAIEKHARLAAHLDLLAIFANNFLVRTLSSSLVGVLWTPLLTVITVSAMWTLFGVFRDIALTFQQPALARHASAIRLFLTGYYVVYTLLIVTVRIIIYITPGRPAFAPYLALALGIPSLLMLLLAIPWTIFLLFRLYQWLRVFQFNAPADPSPNLRPWLPLSLDKLLRTFTDIRRLAYPPDTPT